MALMLDELVVRLIIGQVTRSLAAPNNIHCPSRGVSMMITYLSNQIVVPIRPGQTGSHNFVVTCA